MTGAELAALNTKRIEDLAKRGISVQGMAEQWQHNILMAIAEHVLGPARLEELTCAHQLSVQAALDQVERQVARNKLLAR